MELFSLQRLLKRPYFFQHACARSASPAEFPFFIACPPATHLSDVRAVLGLVPSMAAITAESHDQRRRQAWAGGSYLSPGPREPLRLRDWGGDQNRCVRRDKENSENRHTVQDPGF